MRLILKFTGDRVQVALALTLLAACALNLACLLRRL
jgi:hypothetical protein